MITFCTVPTQPFNVGTTSMVPAEITVVEMALVPIPTAEFPVIVEDPDAELIVHKFGTVHA